MKILVANVGSTSFKYRLFEMDTESELASGRVENIGMATSRLSHRLGGEAMTEITKPVATYPEAIRATLEFLLARGRRVLRALSELSAVAFKVVHAKGVGGTQFLTGQVLAAMEEYNLVAPAHNPPYLRAIRIFQELVPEVPCVGVFETAFHSTIPQYASAYAVPPEWSEKYGVRRYGFHGASHRFIAERVPQLLSRASPGLRIISCHLGGSSSLCAIRDGKSVDTTMGFSPQSGLPQSTRVGDLDPFAVLYVMAKERLSVGQMVERLCKGSGLLALSGFSGDMRDLQEAASRGDEKARLAIESFCYAVRRGIGALAASLEGLDVLVFTGGIGERGASIRRRVCEGLRWLGVELEEASNEVGNGERVISRSDSKVLVLVIPTNEEIIVAREAAALLRSSTGESTTALGIGANF